MIHVHGIGWSVTTYLLGADGARRFWTKNSLTDIFTYMS